MTSTKDLIDRARAAHRRSVNSACLSEQNADNYAASKRHYDATMAADKELAEVLGALSRRVERLEAVVREARALRDEARNARQWHKGGMRPTQCPRLPPSLAISIDRDLGRVLDALDTEETKP